MRKHDALVARMIVSTAEGLPDIGEGDAAFRPVTPDLAFCQRLPAQRIPAPEELTSQYRRHADTYDQVVYPETFQAYNAYFLSERHMTRLACLAVKGGDTHVRALLHLLDDDRPAARYTAARASLTEQGARTASPRRFLVPPGGLLRECHRFAPGTGSNGRCNPWNATNHPVRHRA